MTRLGGRDRGAGVEPLDGEIVVGIGKARTRLAGDRRLAAVGVGLPGDRRQPIDRRALGLEGGIGEALGEAAPEGRLVELRAGIPLRGAGASVPPVERFAMPSAEPAAEKAGARVGPEGQRRAVDVKFGPHGRCLARFACP
jgi:hypothetical protein